MRKFQKPLIYPVICSRTLLTNDSFSLALYQWAKPEKDVIRIDVRKTKNDSVEIEEENTGDLRTVKHYLGSGGVSKL